MFNNFCELQSLYAIILMFNMLLGPFYGAIAVPSVTRCCCRCRGHRYAGGVRQ